MFFFGDKIHDSECSLGGCFDSHKVHNRQ
jgi:hypothetical protein